MVDDSNRIDVLLCVWRADKEYALIVIQNPNPGTEHDAADAN
jgi:hypothetical protein